MSPNHPTAGDTVRSNLGEAGSHLKQAAHDAGSALKGAAAASGDALRDGGRSAADELRLGKANLKADLADSALAGLSAAEALPEATREQVDMLMDKGQDLIESAAELIRERPLASFGVAFAAGWIIARLGGRSDGK
jgi:ElaB/YqjD/DUF883 family membrane-anchored ribosome-binding protein